jgi:hypothetical protein
MVVTPPRRKQELADDPSVRSSVLAGMRRPDRELGGAAGRIADAENIVQQFAQSCLCLFRVFE